MSTRGATITDMEDMNMKFENLYVKKSKMATFQNEVRIRNDEHKEEFRE